MAARPRTTRDLSASEHSFARVLQDLDFGRVESIAVRRGALSLDPWPTVVRSLKFGGSDAPPAQRPVDFDLKKPLADFFEYIRGLDDGVIRRLDVRHGLPFSIEIQYRISRGMPDVKGEHVEAV